MSLNRAMDISATGVEAERRVMELIASNLANITTTHSLTGGPYRRKIAIIGEKPLVFSDLLSQAESKVGMEMGGGVEVLDVVDDKTPFQKVYNPSHPDADAHGYVLMPNVKMSDEMVDMIMTSKLYSANITAFNASKKMITDTLQIQ